MKHILSTLLLSALGLTAMGQKLSPNTEAFLLRPVEKSVRSAGESAATVMAYVKYNAPEAIEGIEALGGTVNSRTTSFLTAEIPVNSLRAISELESVDYVQMGSPVKPNLIYARAMSNADEAHTDYNTLKRAYYGTGVIVGIIDHGFEYGHPAFWSMDGKEYRVKRVWNQNFTSGRTPANFNYGTEYTTKDEILNARYDEYDALHGSHVAGIATGADMSSDYYGFAPDAEIVLVSSGENSVNITDAAKYIFDYAKKVGKPCVINMSIGTHYGPHDGTSTSDLMFDEMVGPGRILVGAAGNEGGINMHLHKKFTEDDLTVKTMINYADDSYQAALLDIWGNHGKHFSVKGVVVDLLKGRIIAETPTLNSTEVGSQRGDFTISATGVDAYMTLVSQSTMASNGRPNIYVESVANHIANNRKLGIIVTGEEGGEIHIWNGACGDLISGKKSGWTNGDDNYTVGEIGSTSNSVISVGSYNTSFEYISLDGSTFSINSTTPAGDISMFSSKGPTLDGRVKPDITAPGMIVISAANQYAINAADAADKTTFNGSNYYYVANAGTSMSTPCVTGTLALWLEANPELTPQRALEILKASAVTDNYTKKPGAHPNNTWGHGKLDTYGGLYIAAGNDTGIQLLEGSLSEAMMKYSRNGRELCLTFPSNMGEVHVSVATASGRVVYNDVVENAHIGYNHTISTAAWPAGVYIVTLNGPTCKQSIKVAL